MEHTQITGVYGELSGLPAPVSACVREEQLPELRSYTVTTEWSQINLVRGSRLRYTQQWTLIPDCNDHKSIRAVLPPRSCAPVSGELLSEFSPIRSLRAVIRETGGYQFLEIWDFHGLRKCLNLTALNEHGRVYDDGETMFALWAPGGQSVVFVGWYHEPFRLGLKFCSNRRSALFKLDLDGLCESLSGDNLSVSCPRLSPDRSMLVYLQGQVFGPHNQCLSLQQLDLKSGKTSTLLDVVSRPQTGEFAGVYEALPSRCWSADSQRVVFSSARRNWKDLFMVDRRSKKVTSLCDSSCDLSRVFGSWKLLTVQKDLMVVCCSSPNTPPTLRVGFLPSAGEAVRWRTLQQPVITFDFQWTVVDVTPPTEEDNTHYCELAVLTVLQSDLTLDPKRLAVIGGSHGGFLSCHLVGQYPDFYRACAARNPVINAATLLGTSDIVDWRYSSVGLQFSYDQIPTSEALAAMLEKSPIKHAAQIKAPVLLMLGGRDRRVSPHQGLELYKALKSRDSPVRLLWFSEDGHSLSRVDTQVDCFLNTVLWLYQHL
ncbi:acylamino-acid-releasing enzyme-like [Seriola lalandi dorsalis]|uniref:acylamino-acid-releasing enzyme-like n=1 Tax=Seriola lalandi dorsalis TaxID=1841481 RepID=UPI000C6FB2D9|nr:acylamino-acid-releasing enzyme-like [Seriola lalandi dorsalis]